MVKITETRSGFKVMSRRLCHFTVELDYCSLTFQTGRIAKLTEVTGYSVLSMVPSALDMPGTCSVTVPALRTEKESEPQKQCWSCLCMQLMGLSVFSPLNRCCRYRGLDRHTLHLPLVHMPIGGNFSG